jgi:hypothetical protein
MKKRVGKKKKTVSTRIESESGNNKIHTLSKYEKGLGGSINIESFKNLMLE